MRVHPVDETNQTASRRSNATNMVPAARLRPEGRFGLASGQRHLGEYSPKDIGLLAVSLLMRQTAAGQGFAHRKQTHGRVVPPA